MAYDLFCPKNVNVPDLWLWVSKLVQQTCLYSQQESSKAMKQCQVKGENLINTLTMSCTGLPVASSTLFLLKLKE